MEKFLEMFPVGTIFKATGASGMLYYGELDEDNIIVLSCPMKGYTGKRLRHTSVHFASINIPDNFVDKMKIMRVIGRTDDT